MFVLMVFFMVSMTLAGEWVAVSTTLATVTAPSDRALSLVHHRIAQLPRDFLGLSLALVQLLVQLLLALFFHVVHVLLFKYTWRSTTHTSGPNENIQKAMWYMNKASELSST